MLWPTVGCSIAAAGLWVARQFIPETLSPYSDFVAFVLIVLMFMWLLRRAYLRGQQRGITDYRRLRQANARHILSSGQAGSDAHEAER